MKMSPFTAKLEQFLRSSVLVKGGFMGDDERSLLEILDADAGELARLGTNQHELARKMKQISDLGENELGLWAKAGENLEVKVDEYLGANVCPWPHPMQCQKRITTVRRISDGREIRFSDLNTHLIDEHGFFQGRGSDFRNEPKDLVDMLLK